MGYFHSVGIACFSTRPLAANKRVAVARTSVRSVQFISRIKISGIVDAVRMHRSQDISIVTCTRCDNGHLSLDANQLVQ
jgi:hypothetical protein